MLCFCPVGSRKEERSGQRDEGQSQALHIRVSTRMCLCLSVCGLVQDDCEFGGLKLWFSR